MFEFDWEESPQNAGPLSFFLWWVVKNGLRTSGGLCRWLGLGIWRSPWTPFWERRFRPFPASSIFFLGVSFVRVLRRPWRFFEPSGSPKVGFSVSVHKSTFNIEICKFPWTVVGHVAWMWFLRRIGSCRESELTIRFVCWEWVMWTGGDLRLVKCKCNFFKRSLIKLMRGEREFLSVWLFLTLDGNREIL